MNHELSLTLELVANTADSLLFGAVVRNRSPVKLLLPYPEIHSLRFTNESTMRESEWCTSLLVSATWAGFTLAPGEEKVTEYRVRPSSVEPPAKDDDYYRWCVDLPNGTYLVRLQFEVGEDYFCPDSHYRYADLLKAAKSKQAAVWLGKVLSNQLKVVRPNQLPTHDSCLAAFGSCCH